MIDPYVVRTKKVLIAGTSPTSVPIIKAVKKQGLSVGVVGGKLDDIGHRIADFSHIADYSDWHNVAKIFEEFGYDFLVPTCNDESLMSCSRVAKEHSLPGFDDLEIAKILQDKQGFRAKLMGITRHAPKVYWSGSGTVPSNISVSFPCIVKPAEASTGKGVEVIYSLPQLDEAVNTAVIASRNGNIVIESFIKGTLHSASIFMVDGSPVATFFVDEYCPDYEFAVSESNHPSKLDNQVREAIVCEISSIVSELKLVNGLFHTQVIVNGDDFVVVESMRRCPGDYYGRLIELSTGYPYHESYISTYLGKQPLVHDGALEIPIARQTLTAKESFISSTMRFASKGHLREFWSMCWSGKQVSEFPADKQGVGFFYYDDLDTMFSEVGFLLEDNGVI